MVRGVSNITTKYKATDGVYSADGKIIIYEGSIKAELNGDVKSNGAIADLIKSFSGEYAVEVSIGSVAVHEAVHNSSDNLQQAVENENTREGEPKHALEVAPLKVQQAHLEEYKTSIGTQKPIQ